MHIDLAQFVPFLVSFLLVLTRVGSAIAIVPIPGMRTAPGAPKAVLVLAVTVSLCRYWMVPTPGDWTASRLVVAVASESAFGLGVGVGVSLLLEAAQVAGQLISLQAGFSYASTIDPASDADSGIILILFQLLTATIFFSLGLDRVILRGFGESLARIPPGTYHLAPAAMESILKVGSAMFQLAFRLALPLTAVLLVSDIALALAGRFMQQLQLSTVLFPVKTLGSLAMLAIASASSGRLIAQWLVEGWLLIHRAAGF
jgi:flagellar biosynthesis protein FliR